MSRPTAKSFSTTRRSNPNNLGELLKSKIAADPDFKVAMKADTNAPFGMIVKVWMRPISRESPTCKCS